MRGFVLAAGFGTRLKPITDILPKALVSVCGVPLVEVALRYLRKQAFETLAVNTHYQYELTEMFVEQLPYSVKIFREEPTILGTGGAIVNAASWLSEESSFAVINADIVTNAPLRTIAAEFEASSDEVWLLASGSGSHTIGMSSEGEFSGRLSELSHPPEESAAFIGIALYKSSTLSSFSSADFDVVAVWNRLRAEGKSVRVKEIPEIYWRDTGTATDLLALYRDIFDKKLKFDFPLGMEVDFERKVAWSSHIDPAVIDPASRYLWVEQVFGERIAGENAVLHGGVGSDDNRFYRDVIVTPWCEASGAGL